MRYHLVIPALAAMAFTSASCCNGKAVAEAEVEAVTIISAPTNLQEGDSCRIETAVEPSSAENRDAIWTSSDRNVLAISSEGVVTAIEKGTAIVTVTIGRKTAACAVTISPKTRNIHHL